MLPFELLQSGCVTVPVIGAEGVPGAAVIVALVEEAEEVQPSLLTTVNE